jgi:hypothetical protein
MLGKWTSASMGSMLSSSCSGYSKGLTDSFSGVVGRSEVGPDAVLQSN